MNASLKRTNLYPWHVEHGGRMVPFAGWEMPVQYPDGPISEHHTTRNAAGLFDIDHMGQIAVRGKDAEAFLNRVVTYDVTKMKLNDAHYALFCYADGGCIDDLFIYKIEDLQSRQKQPYFFLAVNAANREKDVLWLKHQAIGYDVEIEDISDETYMLAFQGPKAIPLLNDLCADDLTRVPRFTAIQTKFADRVPMLLGRTGYTGEDGFELFFPASEARFVWEKILEHGTSAGVKPIGLAARDSLRFEACMPLYGHEISAKISPLEAGLNFAVSFQKEFIGRDALLKQKLEHTERIAAGFEMIEKGVAREGYTVLHQGTTIGFVTSGMYAPTLDKFLGMALISRAYAEPGTEIEILIRNKPNKAIIVPRPFYLPAYRR